MQYILKACRNAMNCMSHSSIIQSVVPHEEDNSTLHKPKLSNKSKTNRSLKSILKKKLTKKRSNSVASSEEITVIESVSQLTIDTQVLCYNIITILI